jgi:hypothetical protein
LSAACAFIIGLAVVETALAQVVVVNVNSPSYGPPAYANYGSYRGGFGNYYAGGAYGYGAYYPQRDYRYQWQTPYYGFRANRVYYGYGYGY